MVHHIEPSFFWVIRMMLVYNRSDKNYNIKTINPNDILYKLNVKENRADALTLEEILAEYLLNKKIILEPFTILSDEFINYQKSNGTEIIETDNIKLIISNRGIIIKANENFDIEISNDVIEIWHGDRLKKDKIYKILPDGTIKEYSIPYKGIFEWFINRIKKFKFFQVIHCDKKSIKLRIPTTGTDIPRNNWTWIERQAMINNKIIEYECRYDPNPYSTGYDFLEIKIVKDEINRYDEYCIKRFLELVMKVLVIYYVLRHKLKAGWLEIKNTYQDCIYLFIYRNIYKKLPSKLINFIEKELRYITFEGYYEVVIKTEKELDTIYEILEPFV